MWTQEHGTPTEPGVWFDAEAVNIWCLPGLLPILNCL